ncbi:MAG: hypothetical protein IKE61_04300, partial [Coriobacteriales bacterium]|nr:hypothetical protein [Coriobacteriales bacterium]
KYEKGLLRADGQLGFNTPTGRIEFSSTLYPMWGEDALPFYEEPRFSQVSQPSMAEEYPLMMTTGSRKYTSFHSEHRQVDILRRIDKWPVVEVHPETAKKYGLQDGDWAEISNMFGRAKAKVVITPIVDPRIVNATHGWWFPEQDGEAPNLFGVWKSNVNTMIPNLCIGKLGFGAPYKGIMCKIEKSTSVED